MLRGFLGTLVGGSLFLTTLLISPEAFAVTCITGGRGYGTTTTANDNQYGALVHNLIVINANPACVLVRSIYVYDAMTNHFEMGWYQDGNQQSVGICTDFQTPHLLMYQQRNGAISCHPSPTPLTIGEDYSFKISNPDHDLTFSYYWDADASPNILIGTYTGNFSHGMARSGDEHHHPDVADSLKADFTGMESMDPADAWGPFPAAALYTNNPVTGWTVCSWGNSSLIVKQSGNC